MVTLQNSYSSICLSILERSNHNYQQKPSELGKSVGSLLTNLRNFRWSHKCVLITSFGIESPSIAHDFTSKSIIITSGIFWFIFVMSTSVSIYSNYLMNPFYFGPVVWWLLGDWHHPWFKSLLLVDYRRLIRPTVAAATRNCLGSQQGFIDNISQLPWWVLSPCINFITSR